MSLQRVTGREPEMEKKLDSQSPGPLGWRKKPRWPFLSLWFLPEERCGRPGLLRGKAERTLQREAVIKLNSDAGLTSQTCIFCAQGTQAGRGGGWRQPGTENPAHVPRREREKDEWDAQSPNKNPGELGKRDLFVNGYIPEGFLEEVEWSYILDRTILEGEDDEMSM